MWAYTLTALAAPTVLVYYRPVADITKQWTPSTGSDNYVLVNEITASDTSYVSTTTNAKVDEYLLEPIQQPPANTDLVINIRLKTINAISVKVALYNDSTLVQESSPLTSSTENYESASITIPYATWSTANINWSNIRIRITSVI